jgi:hypothetical protein
MLFGQHLDRAWRQFVTAACGAIGLGEDADHLVPR